MIGYPDPGLVIIVLAGKVVSSTAAFLSKEPTKFFHMNPCSLSSSVRMLIPLCFSLLRASYMTDDNCGSSQISGDNGSLLLLLVPLTKKSLLSHECSVGSQASRFTAATRILVFSFQQESDKTSGQTSWNSGSHGRQAVQQLFTMVSIDVHTSSVTTPATQNGSHIDNKMRDVI